MPECPHGEDPRWCVWCTPTLIPVAQTIPTFSYTGREILASFNGKCGHCGEEIEVGDRIAYFETVGGWCLADHITVPGAFVAESEIDLSGDAEGPPLPGRASETGITS